MNLYFINSVYEQIIQQCREYAEEHEGEISSELSEQLDMVVLDKETKIENTIMYYKNESAIAAMIQAEIDSLSERMKRHKNNAEWTKKYLQSFVPEKQKLEYPTGKISWKESTSVDVVDISLIPDKYLRIIPEQKEADKNAIKAAIKTGEEVSGIQIITKQNMSIK
jgi:hypothetical protein